MIRGSNEQGEDAIMIIILFLPNYGLKLRLTYDTAQRIASQYNISKKIEMRFAI